MKLVHAAASSVCRIARPGWPRSGMYAYGWWKSSSGFSFSSDVELDELAGRVLLDDHRRASGATAPEQDDVAADAGFPARELLRVRVERQAVAIACDSSSSRMRPLFCLCAS